MSSKHPLPRKLARIERPLLPGMQRTEHQALRQSRAAPGMLAVPCVQWMWTLSARALIDLTLCLPAGSAVCMPQFGASSIAASRNQIVHAFLECAELEWLLMCDSDMQPPPETISRLLAMNVDVAAGFYFNRTPPFIPAMQPTENLATHDAWRGVREMHWVGFGCVLIRRYVLETVSQPWFDHPAPGVGEDTFFCAKARGAGFRIWADLDLPIGHVTPLPITPEFALVYHNTPTGQRSLDEWQVSADGRRCADAFDAAFLAEQARHNGAHR